ncbi:MAG: elongation factor G [Candidatus Eisenbacteria bacterium]|uniref:Elongation factor G n=1 Tax=Eiseniibacteriota bacterium TaxID=2212470 RepID=A0A538TI72_UNCEI|nr:MAG: elongation factor G [Candidatus Eisenbacteria bacterium]
MKEFQPGQIRNVALASHHGTGKTSLAESLLFRTKAIARHGKIEEGTTALDFSPEEIHRKITISLSVAPVEWRGNKINVIDTPGYADFAGDCVAGLRAADAAVFCLKAAAGVEAGTEMIWERVHERACPVLCAVTQMEKEHANFAKTIQGATDRLGMRFVAIAWPFGGAEKFKGLVDLASMKAYHFDKDGGAKEGPIPPELDAEVKTARAALVDAAAEADDALLEKFLGGEELNVDEIHKGLREGVIHRSFVPALPVAAVPMLGIDFFLDAIVDVMPSPADLGTVKGTKPGSQDVVELKPEAGAPLSALVFKTSSESHAGDLSIIRVYSGTLSPGKEVWNSTAQRAEKTGQLFTVRGKERADAGHIPAGDIGAAVKLRETHTGQTLCDKHHQIVLPPIPFPGVAHEIAIAPKSKGEEEKMGSGLHKLREEDPTLHVRVEGDLHQTILSCMGDLQVEVALEKLNRRFGVHVGTAKPRIPYRETIRRSVSKQGRHKKQTGGRGQFGDVHVRLEPLKHGAGFEFVDEVVGGSVPRNFIPAVEKGIIEAMHEGVLAGYPVVDVRAALYDGSYHSVDSSEMAFKIAGSIAFKEGAREAGPVLLEPIVEIEVRVPKDFVGAVTGDLSSKRGKILGMDAETRYDVIRAQVPQAELYKYSTHLRSLTQGRASHRTKFSHYEEIPRELAEKIIAQAKADREAMASA